MKRKNPETQQTEGRKEERDFCCKLTGMVVLSFCWWNLSTAKSYKEQKRLYDFLEGGKWGHNDEAEYASKLLQTYPSIWGFIIYVSA